MNMLELEKKLIEHKRLERIDLWWVSAYIVTASLVVTGIAFVSFGV